SVLAGSASKYHQWTWVDSNAVVFGSVGSFSGFTCPVDFSLTAHGAVTQTAPVVTHGLALLVDAGVTLTDNGNDFGTIAGRCTSSSGLSYSWTLVCRPSCSIATVGAVSGLSIVGDLSLTCDGAVSQTQP